MFHGDARLYLTNILFTTYFCSNWWHPTCHITLSLTGQPWITGDSWSGFKCMQKAKVSPLQWLGSSEGGKIWISNHYRCRENKNLELFWVMNNYYLDALQNTGAKNPHSPIYSAAMQHQFIPDPGKGQGNDRAPVPALQAVVWHGETEGSQGQVCPPMVFPCPFPPGPRAGWREPPRELPQQLVCTGEGGMTFWSQAFGRLGFKNTKGLLQEVHGHVSYTMWKRCHKIIDEGRSLAKGDTYFGGWLPAEMTICVKSNQTGHQYACQLKK